MEDNTAPTKKTPTGGYEVGYCRPPVESRFKPGEVHNRRGRRRKAPTFDEALKKVLAEKITIRVGEQVAKVTKGEAIVRRLLEKYAKNDARAQRLVLSLLAEFDREVTEEQNPEISGVLEVPHEFLDAFNDALAEEQRRNPSASYDDQQGKAWEQAQRLTKPRR